MTTATIVFDDQQEAEITKQLAKRNADKAALAEPNLTLDEYCTLELVYALNLTESQLSANEVAEIAEKYASLSDEEKAKIKAAIEAAMGK